MRREDLFMDILGDLDEEYIAIALPGFRNDQFDADIRIVSNDDTTVLNREIRPKSFGSISMSGVVTPGRTRSAIEKNENSADTNTIDSETDSSFTPKP